LLKGTDMSRHPVIVRSADRADENAIIGYDPPMRTYFLQAFEDPTTEQPRLWLGTRFDQYPDLASLIAAANERGFDLDTLDDEILVEMAREAAQPRGRSLMERLGWPLS
jgi:hypothetical protein